MAGAELKPPGPLATDRETVSVEPAPLVITLPLLSSMATLKVVRADPAVPVAGGDKRYATLLAGDATMENAGVLAAVATAPEESVAFKV